MSYANIFDSLILGSSFHCQDVCNKKIYPIVIYINTGSYYEPYLKQKEVLKFAIPFPNDLQKFQTLFIKKLLLFNKKVFSIIKKGNYHFLLPSIYKNGIGNNEYNTYTGGFTSITLPCGISVGIDGHLIPSSKKIHFELTAFFANPMPTSHLPIQET
jgi:hypothetical protein